MAKIFQQVYQPRYIQIYGSDLTPISVCGKGYFNPVTECPPGIENICMAFTLCK